MKRPAARSSQRAHRCAQAGPQARRRGITALPLVPRGNPPHTEARSIPCERRVETSSGARRPLRAEPASKCGRGTARRTASLKAERDSSNQAPAPRRVDWITSRVVVAVKPQRWISRTGATVVSERHPPRRCGSYAAVEPQRPAVAEGLSPEWPPRRTRIRGRAAGPAVRFRPSPALPAQIRGCRCPSEPRAAPARHPRRAVCVPRPPGARGERRPSGSTRTVAPFHLGQGCMERRHHRCRPASLPCPP